MCFFFRFLDICNIYILCKEMKMECNAGIYMFIFLCSESGWMNRYINWVIWKVEGGGGGLVAIDLKMEGWGELYNHNKRRWKEKEMAVNWNQHGKKHEACVVLLRVEREEREKEERREEKERGSRIKWVKKRKGYVWHWVRVWQDMITYYYCT